MLTKAQAQSYAIGPSLHDWEYEEWSERAAQRDAALESFAKDWESDLISDGRCEAFGKIDETMESVFDGIYTDVSKSERFNRLMFKLWAGGSDCIGQIKKMIHEEMNKVISEEFEKGTDRP